MPPVLLFWRKDRTLPPRRLCPKTVLLQVEKGIERFAYAKRWKEKISKRREHSPHRDTSVRTTSVERSGTPTSEDTAPVQSTTEEDAAGEPAERRDRNGDFSTQDGEPAERMNRTTQDAPGGTDDRDENGEERQRKGCVPNLAFRFQDIGKNFPESCTAETEICLQKLKDDIIRTYKNHKVSEENVDSQQRKFVKDLANNDNVIIKQSDKCKGFVILDRAAYVDKAKAMLEDRDSYESVNKNPIPQVEARTKRALLNVTRDKLPWENGKRSDTGTR